MRWMWLEGLTPDKPRQAVTVTGLIAAYEADDQDDSGARHQVFRLAVQQVTGAPRKAEIRQGDEVYIVIRFGDSQGLKGPIPGIAAGNPVEARGVYVPPEEAYKRDPDVEAGVIHFTHRPVGWVRYQGVTYR